MRRRGFNWALFELAAQQAAANPIVPVHDPNPRYPLDMSMEEIERAIRASAEHFGHVMPVQIGEGAARRLRELVEAPEPAPTLIWDAERDRTTEMVAKDLEITFGAPVKGNIIAQAKGPNRAQRRACK